MLSIPVHPQLRPSEQPIHQGPANLQRGRESVGGRLFLTTQRLLFHPHACNVQRATIEIPLSSLVGTERVWTRLFGAVPVLPNSLAVRLDDSSVLRFVVHNRILWQRHIDEQAARRARAEQAGQEAAELTIAETWARLERAAASQLGEGSWAFGEPATPQQIEAAERILGIEFPPCYRASLLLHDGDAFRPSGTGTVSSMGPFDALDLLPLSAVVAEWQVWQEFLCTSPLAPNADPGVRAVWWSPKWIPITVIGGETRHHCLDLDPGRGGTVGQVIEVCKSDGDRTLRAPSYQAFLSQLTREILDGRFAME